MLLIASVAALTWLLAFVPRTIRLAQTGVDARGLPFGGDFIAFWAGSKLALEGRAIEAFDPELYFAVQDAALLGNQAHFLWNYPPTYHLLVSPLALVDLVSACLIWWAVTIPLYLFALWKVVPRWETPVVALSASAVLLNLAHGQNGFLLTAIFVGGLAAVLGKRAILGGALLGLLVLKPHFGVLVPVALVAGRCWPALVAFVASSAALLGVSTAVFGLAYWGAFFENLSTVRAALVGARFPFGKLVTPYVSAASLGAPDAVASAAQAVFALFAVAAVAWSWRTPSRWSAAVLLASAPLISPYFYDYDLLLWSGAAVFAVSSSLDRGFKRGEAELWVVAALVPVMLQPIWASTGVQLGGFATVGLLVALLAFRPR